MYHFTVPLNHKIHFPQTMSIAGQSSSETNRVFPNDSSIHVDLPSNVSNDEFVLVGPRLENNNQHWPPINIAAVKDGGITLENRTDYPITVENM